MHNTGGNGSDRMAALESKLDSLMETAERLEARIDSLYDECQRAASSGQRMLLRQEKLEKSLARIEAMLQKH